MRKSLNKLNSNGINCRKRGRPCIRGVKNWKKKKSRLLMKLFS